LKSAAEKEKEGNDRNPLFIDGRQGKETWKLSLRRPDHQKIRRRNRQ
jgi:hypothetical protein